MLCHNIIKEVREHPELWQFVNAYFGNRPVVNRTWKSIAKKLNMDESSIKKRWKNLKDVYRKEFKKFAKLSSDSSMQLPDDYTPQWKYFNEMSFMKDEILRNSKTNLSTSISFVEIPVDSICDEDNFSDEEELISRSPKKIKTDAEAEDNPNVDTDRFEAIFDRLTSVNEMIGSKICAYEESQKNDSDYMFLVSILPSMKKLTNIQKLQFRGKINDWLLDELTKNETKFKVSIESD